MSKSIMHDKRDGTCYLCALLHQDYGRRSVLEEHHVMNGNPNRRWSEKYGLKVYLCIPHHREGGEAVHNNSRVRKLLQQKAQEAFEQKYPQLSFREIFGKNCSAGEKAAGTAERSGKASGTVPDGIRFFTDVLPERTVQP